MKKVNNSGSLKKALLGFFSLIFVLFLVLIIAWDLDPNKINYSIKNNLFPEHVSFEKKADLKSISVDFRSDAECESLIVIDLLKLEKLETMIFCRHKRYFPLKKSSNPIFVVTLQKQEADAQTLSEIGKFSLKMDTNKKFYLYFERKQSDGSMQSECLVFTNALKTFLKQEIFVMPQKPVSSQLERMLLRVNIMF